MRNDFIPITFPEGNGIVGIIRKKNTKEDSRGRGVK
jgi:hypothetical protein